MGYILGTLNIKMVIKIFRINIVAIIPEATLLRDVSIKLGLEYHLTTVYLSVKYLVVNIHETNNKKYGIPALNKKAKVIKAKHSANLVGSL